MRGETVGWLSELVSVREFRFHRGTHEVVAVVDDQRDARMVFLVDTPRELRRDDHRAFQFPVAHIFHGLPVAVVGDRHEGSNVRPHGIECFANLQSLRTAVLVDDGNPGIANFSAKRVAQNDQLHQRKDHRRQHQRRRTKELAHLALDNGHHPIHPNDSHISLCLSVVNSHGCNPGRCGITNAYAFVIHPAAVCPCNARRRRRASCSAPRATSLALRSAPPFRPVRSWCVSRCW